MKRAIAVVAVLVGTLIATAPAEAANTSERGGGSTARSTSTHLSVTDFETSDGSSATAIGSVHEEWGCSAAFREGRLSVQQHQEL